MMPGVKDRLKPAASKSLDLVSRLPKKWALPPLLVIAILTGCVAADMPDDNFHVSFLDVGQGDAILIQRGSQQILIDGGPSPQAIALELGKEMPFWDRTIDLVVLTHPHADHLAGLLEVMKRYEVKQVLYPGLEDESPLYDEWLSLIAEKGTATTLAQAGQQISFAGATIRVLGPTSPPLTGTESDTDNNSVVLRLEIGEMSFLLTGDIMWEAEFELIAQGVRLASTILKVAHHGSTTSTTAELLAEVNPRIAIITVGSDNPFGLPGSEVLTRLEQYPELENIYRTDESGTIRFTTDRERLWVRTQR